MLEADDVDDDYFAPIPSTSLASIFGNSSQRTEETENESLKYVPPKAEDIKKVLPKVTECVYACGLYGYQWVQNAYNNKGKLGLAIIKNRTTNDHDILLYNRNKITLSNARITSHFEVARNGKRHISYYDNLNSYWSVSGAEEEINKIVEALSKLNVNVKFCPHTDKGPPEPNKSENEIISTIGQSDKESDTDSLNRRTKASILNRMANMGQSVLPRLTVSTEETSDSSDNDVDSHSKAIRFNKPVKNIVRRMDTDRKDQNMTSVGDPYNKVTASQPRQSVTASQYTNINRQLVPIENDNVTIIAENTGDNINLLLTEQRVNNTELRINIVRMTDKVDQLFDKMKDIGDNAKNNNTLNFQSEIVQKLLTEYENKIKMYEEIIGSTKADSHIVETKILKKESNVVASFTNKIAELENTIQNNNKEICKLNEEIRLLRENSTQSVQSQVEIDLLNENFKLKQTLNTKQIEIDTSNRKLEYIRNNADSTNDVDKLKTVMNNTYRTLAINFDNSETYSGDTIKNIIATVIKKVTMDSLGE